MSFNLENSVNHNIATIAVLLKRQVYRVIADHKLNITPDQWVVMYYLWEENGLSVGEIAKRSKKDFANVTRIIEKLKKLGYINKKKSKKDSRVSHIYILPEADQLKDKIYKSMIESTALALEGFNDSEQEVLLALLKRIEHNILKKA